MTQAISTRYLGDQGQYYESQRQIGIDNPGYTIDFAYFQPYLDTDQIVLDFGCGNGGILRHVQKVVTQVDGVEVNPSVREKAALSGSLIYPSLEAVPSSNRYDIIYSNHVLEHCRDVCGILEKLRLVLKPGGRIILKLPFDDANSAYQRSWSQDDVDHHLQTWTPRLLANTLTESGYSVRECRVITSAWHSKLFFLRRLGLSGPAFWALAVVKRRRQTFAVAVNPVR